jgi:formyltetrahydrofolate-dependent phosphoribosylglycinamide formyltransferase
MVQSTGTKKLKCAVFISGTGSNLKSLIQFAKKKNSPISIELIISDNPKAKGLKFGKNFKILNKVINYKNKIIAEKKIISEINNKKIKLICLAGFMRILSKNFIKRFKGKILNIHPSLLPKYKGLNTHQRAISNNEKYSGCTVHVVNSRLDAGKIILQKKVKISKFDTAKSLAKKVLIQEHKLYPKAIRKVLSF